MSDAANPNRSRTVTWEDPLPVARAAQTMSGLEFIRALAAGKLYAHATTTCLIFPMPVGA